ncbi:Hypothetical_protein [Hexamita inflata]|uniref:Hypothetical_protein n=1 Tax=Hexamita inflata TaxID=28002 RepID=A0AA86R5H5_9EUKA|nr:Hypothetical protein HINF_LOCUS53934 [Hexamita inflata]
MDDLKQLSLCSDLLVNQTKNQNTLLTSLKLETKSTQKSINNNNMNDLEEILQNQAKDHVNMKIRQMKSNLMIFIFYRRNLISKDRGASCQLQRIYLTNIEEVLHQKEQNQPSRIPYEAKAQDQQEQQNIRLFF